MLTNVQDLFFGTTDSVAVWAFMPWKWIVKPHLPVPLLGTQKLALFFHLHAQVRLCRLRVVGPRNRGLLLPIGIQRIAIDQLLRGLLGRLFDASVGGGPLW